MRAEIVLLLLAGCGAGARAVMLDPAAGAVADAPALERHLAAGERRVVGFFGAPFPRPVVAEVAADRAAFDAALRRGWKDPTFTSECWMVGAGMDRAFVLLSPRRWKAEACEHDPGDDGALGRLIAHELVHVYHNQKNPSLSADSGVDLEPIGWFVEGVAVLASGQLADGQQAPAAEALATGHGPARLAEAWSGKYRYGVSGSLVAFIDATWGRAMVTRLLGATRPEEILAALGTTEDELLGRWRAWVQARGG